MVVTTANPQKQQSKAKTPPHVLNETCKDRWYNKENIIYSDNKKKLFQTIFRDAMKPQHLTLVCPLSKETHMVQQ